MWKAMCSRHELHYNRAYGLTGMLIAAVIVVLMRRDMAQALTFAVATVSGTGWTYRRTGGRSSVTAGHEV